jgi:hypothetical protein
MKFGLQRIGAMLDQLNTQNDVPNAATSSSNRSMPPIAGVATAQPPTDPLPQLLYSTHRQPNLAPLPVESGAANETVQPFQAQDSSLSLPKSKAVSVSSYRHAVNPNLAMSLLKDIETTIIDWQLQLEQTILQIQAVYADGPIVEGWLESQANETRPSSSAGVATLRHGEVDRLMDYVEAICNPNQGSHNQLPVPVTQESEDFASRTDYRLCGLDADGQLWSRPCPTPQVPYVSLAIARYQKLRILLSQKQTLENRLNQLIQSLTVLSGQIQKS